MENVPAAMSEQDLTRLFEVYGPVARVLIVQEKGSRNAIIEMRLIDDAMQAIDALDGREFYGQRVRVYEESVAI